METSPITLYTEKRPWGSFTDFIKNIPSTVKIITVNPNQELSLQYHHNRDEFWFVISGNGIATIGDSKLEIKSESTCFIPRKINHRVKALNEKLIFLEISFGDFDENDIVRLSDDYGRVV